MTPVTPFQKLTSIVASKILLFFVCLSMSIQALASVPIYSDKNPSLDGGFTISWSSSIWNYFHSSANSGYVHVEYRPEVGSGDFSMSVIQTYTRISSYTFSNKEAGEYRLQFRACGTYSSGRSGGCILTSTVLVEVREADSNTDASSGLPALSFDSGLSGWTNTSAKVWSIRSNGTPSSYTGPSGAVDGSNYAYMETSSGSAYTAGDKASLTSPSFSLYGAYVSFHYHMYGADIGTLELQVVQNGVATTIWQRTGQQQSSSTAFWKLATASLAGFSGTAQLRFVGTAAGGYRGDMAIDKIEILRNDPPYDVSATAVGSDSVQISWNAEASSDCNAFVIYYENLAGNESNDVWVSNCNDRERTIPNLGGGRWQFKVSQYFQRDFCIPGDDCLNEEWESRLVTAGTVVIGDADDDAINPLDPYANDPLATVPDPENSVLDGLEYFGALEGKHAVGADGSFNYSIPIDVSPGIQGLQPKLSLSYNSGARNGLLGWGWNLQGLSSITRCKASVIRDGYAGGVLPGDDYKYCFNGQRLIEVAAGEYRTEVERYAHIFKRATYWEVKNKNGVVERFGYSANSRESDSEGDTSTWHLDKVSDIWGNFYSVTYQSDNSVSRPSEILYTTMPSNISLNKKIIFEYEDRPDPVSRYFAGVYQTEEKRLTGVSVVVRGVEAWRYDLDYQFKGRSYYGKAYLDPANISRLASVRRCFNGKCQKKIEFDWTKVHTSSYTYAPSNNNVSEVITSGDLFDIDNDGEIDEIDYIARTQVPYNYTKTDYNSSATGVPVEVETMRTSIRDVVDIDGDGYKELTQRNAYGEEGFNLYPNIADGDGRTISTLPLPGYHIPVDQLSFIASRKYSKYDEHFRTRGPVDVYTVEGFRFAYEIEFADINGDGLKDVVRSVQGCPTAYLYCFFGNPNASSVFGDYDNKEGYPKEISVAYNTGTGWERSANGVVFHTLYDNRDNRELETKLHFSDLNSDGLADVVTSGGGLDSSVPKIMLLNVGNSTGHSLVEISRYTDSRHSGDFNGDGFVDQITVPSWDGRGDFQIALSNGLGFEELKAVELPEIASGLCGDDSDSICGFMVADFNGDGLQDLIQSGISKSRTGCSAGEYNKNCSPFEARVWVSNGSDATGKVSFSSPIIYKSRAELNLIAPKLPRIDPEQYEAKLNFQDYNSDGILEDDVRLTSSLKPHRIERVLYGSEEIIVEYDVFSETSIYKSDVAESYEEGENTDELNIFVKKIEPKAKKFGVRLLSVSSAKTGVENAFDTWTYEYAGKRVHTAGYGNLGFAQKTVTERRYGRTDYLKSVTDYHQLATASYRLAGVPKRSRNYAYTEEHGEQLISDTRTKWKIRTYSDDIDSGFNSPHYFPYVYESSTKAWDINGAELTTTLNRNYVPSSYSCSELSLSSINSVLTTSAGAANDSEYHADGVLLNKTSTACDAAYTAMAGVSAPNRNNSVRINKVSNQSIVTKGDVRGLVQTKVVSAGTGSNISAASSLSSRSVNFTYYNSGALHTQTMQPGTGNRLTTTYGYNGWGAVNSINESWLNSATDGLPGTNRTTGITSTYLANGKLEVTTTQPLVGSSVVVYDEVFGNPESNTDINDIVTSVVYDDFGRPVLETTPLGTTQVDYRTCSNCTFDSNAVWYTQTKVTGSADARVYYDARNREVGVRDWSLAGATESFTRYNALGKVASVLHTAYSGSGNQVTQYTYDVLGRVTTTEFPNNSSATTLYQGFTTRITNQEDQEQVRISNGAGWVVQSIDNDLTPVDFTYTAFGDLATTMVDGNADTLVQIGYNSAGQKETLLDPNAGLTSYTYNALGLVVTETDAKNQVTSYTYDQLGRDKTRTDAGTYTHTWVYDENNHKGMLTSLSGYTTEGKTYKETYGYDSNGLPTTVNAIFEGKNYSVTQGYDDYGRQLSTSYPSNYQIANIYNDKGFLTKVVNIADNRPLWVANEANAEGQVTEFTLGDGSVTNKVFTEETGLVESITATRGGATLMNQSYIFDNIGKLQSRTDSLNSVVESFCYDNMNRLTASRFNGCSESDSDFTYDELGNIRSKVGVGSYAYTQTNNAGPHAVTSANGLSYEYDAAGNIEKARNSANQIVKEVTWNAIGKPTRMSKGSNWTEVHYGPDTSRIKRTDSTGRTTFYFGNLFEETNFGLESKRVHYIGDFALYIEDGITGEGFHQYLHRDHLGSVVAKTSDADVADKEYLAYSAWGSRLLTAWDGIEEGPGYQSESVRGYTDHEHLDPVGLIHMNGRVYVPELGRFLSPDPFVQAPYNTQSYNRYSYVFNNPLSFTDPSGYFAECCSGYNTEETEPSIGYRSGVTPSEYAALMQQYAYQPSFWESPGYYMPVVNHDIANVIVGFGDALLMDLGQDIRDSLDISGGVDIDSKSYAAGGATGTVVDTVAGGGFFKKLISALSKKVVKKEAAKQSPSIREQALDLKKANGDKNRVTIQTPDKKIHYDLDGATHKGVETPHVQNSYPNTNPNTGETFWNKDRKNVEPMTQQDIRTVRNYLERQNN